MSTRPSLVLDVCELLRSLLFPFELCAPYVPRLTEPFMSCLDFPGAIFVGIHDDGTLDGLAAVVRKDMPEDSTIVDLDCGSVDCSGNRYVEESIDNSCLVFFMERPHIFFNAQYPKTESPSSTVHGVLSPPIRGLSSCPSLKRCVVMLESLLVKNR